MELNVRKVVMTLLDLQKVLGDRTVALTAIELTKLERCIDEHIKTVRYHKKENE